MNEPKSYVRKDEHGVLRVGSQRTMLDGVVYSFLEGDSPESIRQAFPALTLEDVYGAITFYLANRETVDAYLREQEARFEKLRAEQDRNPPEVIKRLLAIKASRAQSQK